MKIRFLSQIDAPVKVSNEWDVPARRADCDLVCTGLAASLPRIPVPGFFQQGPEAPMQVASSDINTSVAGRPSVAQTSRATRQTSSAPSR